MHAFALVTIEDATAADRGLLQQQVDVGTARQHSGAQQRLAVRVRVIHWGATSLHFSSFLLNARRARKRWLRTAGSVLPVAAATSAYDSPSKW